jgi:1,2-phenylacetyl-CoA epoxidase catalytic subunit
MAMASFGAPDVQRNGINTIRLSDPSELLPGDLLGLALDAKGRASGKRAHHVQVVVQKSDTQIVIYQGNSDWTIHKPVTYFNKLFGRNAADPVQTAYAGMATETGQFTRTSGSQWDYKNNRTGATQSDYLQYFELFRWSFMEFNN